MLPLLQTDQIIARSIYHALREHVVEHGYLPDEDDYGDSASEAARWNQDVALIDATKGFHIDMFSESSARHKGMKNTPRIIIFLSNQFDGDIGAPPAGVLGRSITDPTKYRYGGLPSKSTSLVFAIHLMSINSKQSSILNSILANVLGNRAFIKYYNNLYPTQRLLCVQTSFADLDNAQENILEKAYFYRVPDVFLGAEKIIREDVSPIKEITLEQRANLDEDSPIDNESLIE